MSDKTETTPAAAVETDDAEGHHWGFGAVPEPESEDVEGHRLHHGGAVPEPETDDVEGHRLHHGGAVPEPETDDVEGHSASGRF